MVGDAVRIEISSAYIKIDVLGGFGMSERRMENSKGLSTEPCGTPVLSGYDEDCMFPMDIEKLLSERKLLIQAKGVP